MARIWLSSVVTFVALTVPLAAAESSGAEFFEMKVRPVLVKNCQGCHGPSGLAGLSLTSREALLKGGKSGPAVIAGDPDKSLLIQAVAQTHERLKMPPTGKLADNQIADLRTWVKSGAVWPESKGTVPAAATPGKEYQITQAQRDFWSFQPVRNPAVPAVHDRKWARTPIDQFILAKLEEKGLKPTPAADKRVLLRRVTLDLTGLPPKPEEIDAFLQDRSPDAFAKVVDRLLASPHYGERWGRYWLDIARYSDDKLSPQNDDPYPNAFRYRDWVIQAMNEDMPYDLFLKAQIAGDLLPGDHKEKLAAGLGFYALSPEFQEDRVDATTRGMLGLTVACATCHDHKFDPIPTKDFYSLLGVFMSTQRSELPLAPESEVQKYKDAKKKLDDLGATLSEFQKEQADSLAQVLAAKTSRYLVAAYQVIGPAQVKSPEAAKQAGLDLETLDRWVKYLRNTNREHPLLKPWDELVARKASDEDVKTFADRFQAEVMALDKEKRSIDEQNNIRLGGSKERGNLANADLVSLERNKFILWRDVFADGRGVLNYRNRGLERFLQGEWKDHLTELRAEEKRLKDTMPAQYPYLQVISDNAKPGDIKVRIRGSADNLGEVAPRRFLRILSDGEPPLFKNGSGRLELAEAIASPKNPLTARVIVNRVWAEHFGQGIVRTPSNFGQLGERPSHPELLDYLASRLMAENWSLKKLHREIVLSATYAESAVSDPKAFAADPDNRLCWRANRRRLDAEAVRDELLAVTAELDETVGGPPVKIADDKNTRRTLYGFVSRRSLDPTLELFDFPNPNNTSEQRDITSTPLQRLFFLNSPFVMQRAEALAKRLTAGTNDAKVRQAYRLVYGRQPTAEELSAGVEFLQAGDASLPQYAQVLLSANEFLFVN